MSNRERSTRWGWAIALAISVVAVGCTGGSRDVTTTVSPQLSAQPLTFSPVIPGQLAMVVVEASTAAGPVALTATLAGAGSVEPASSLVEPGGVAEFVVVAAEDAVGTSLIVSVEAEGGSDGEDLGWAIEVVEWEDTIEPMAVELRERFVTHLETANPELGITSRTEWTPSITKPQILEVMHYLFFSDDWEMGITWHVTVPEHAWARMYLRPRDQLLPTVGLEIPSYPDPASIPVAWSPPAELDR